LVFLSHDSSFPFPRYIIFFGVTGPEGDEEPSGEKFLRLIQIRLATPSVEKLGKLGKIKLRVGALLGSTGS